MSQQQTLNTCVTCNVWSLHGESKNLSLNWANTSVNTEQHSEVLKDSPLWEVQIYKFLKATPYHSILQKKTHQNRVAIFYNQTIC